MRRILKIFAFLTLLAITTLARANGVYIPEKAYPALPTIPVQRAIIVHRDGIETLIVESAFQTDSKNVAWILPLPAPPTKLDLGDPGMITSACTALRPKITHDLSGLAALPLYLLAAIIPLVLVKIFTPDPVQRRQRYIAYTGFTLLVVFLYAILLPNLAGGGASVTADTSGITIHGAQRLGDYQTTTLSAKTASDLSDWLAAQSLKPLDAAAQQIIAGYIARRWCFIVTALHRDAAGPAIPRPLIATFPAASPIFPMKLTSLANTTTHVALCIIADQQATATYFHCQVADRFASARSESTDLRIGSPDVFPLLWTNCVVTKLVADLPPANMSSDITMVLRPLASHRDHFISEKCRGEIMWGVLLCIPSFLLILFLVGYRRGHMPKPFECRLAIYATALLLLVAILLWLILPVVPVQTSSWRTMVRYRYVLENTVKRLAASGSIRPHMTSAEFAALPGISRDAYNPYTNEPIRRERSPGNFDIRTFAGQLNFCTYDIDGSETCFPLELPATTTSQPTP